MNAVGRAQARYLWVLLIVALFYPALRAKFSVSPVDAQVLKVPFIDLEFDAGVVLGSGPAVIALIVLIVLGTLRAIRVAVDHIDPSLQIPGEMERFDLHPNGLDLALYTTHQSPRLLAAAFYILYPLLLLAALGEAAWLWLTLSGVLGGRSSWTVLRWVAVPLWLSAVWLVLVMLGKRIARSWRGEHMKRDPVARSATDPNATGLAEHPLAKNPKRQPS